MKCDDVRPLLSAWMDGEGPSDEVRAHVESCDACRAHVEKYRRADELLRAAAAKMAPEKHGTDRIVAAAIRRRPWARYALSAAAVVVVAVALSAIYVNTRTASPLEVAVYARPEAVAGAPARLMFLVRNHQTGDAVAGARVKAHAGGETVEAASDEHGVVNISFPAPESDFEATAEVTSPIGSETLTHRFAVRRPRKLLITTDKPLYQPEQIVHLRVLAMNTFTQRPVVGGELSVEVIDPNGNKVFRRSAKTSDFGSAAFDFTLADEVTFGTYRVTASIGDLRSERTIEVKRYVLPKFKVELALDRTFYAPGQKLAARGVAHYFFGAPVANAEVKVTGSAWLVDKFEPAFERTVRTDTEGRFAFEQTLEGRFFGTELAGGDATVRVEAAVTDGADHTESKAKTVAVSKDALKLWILPEGGAVVKGVENRWFVVTAYPDGSLAPCTLTVGDRALESLGVSEVTGGESLSVMARDEKGATASATSNAAQRSFVVRADRFPRGGQPLGVVALCAFAEGSLYVDLVREGVTVATKTMRVKGGRGDLTFDLPAEAAGTMQLSAYRIGPKGEIERDTRVVLVAPSQSLQIELTTQDTHRPGDEIALNVRVRDAEGRPVVAELALALVDEAVFAMHESRPGLEKVYFWIQEQLLEPHGQLKECTPLRAPVGMLMSNESLLRARVGAAVGEVERAIPAMIRGFSVRQRELREFAREFNRTLRRVVVAAVALAIIVSFGIHAARRRRKTSAAVGFALGAACGLVFVFALTAPFIYLLQGIGSQKGVAMAPPPGGIDISSVGPANTARIREHFPETLYWNPAVVTDERGRAEVAIPGADSITTWRATASAVSKAGALGAADRGVRVFQEFFIDLDLPVALTQGDVVSIPVACYNYLDAPQSVTVRLVCGDAFTLSEQAEKTVELEPNAVRAVYFEIRAARFGRHEITVFARSAHAEDAVRRTLEVLPDGREQMIAASEPVNGRAKLKLRVPDESIDGATQMWVRLYPSRLSEVVSGLERLVQMPYG